MRIPRSAALVELATSPALLDSMDRHTSSNGRRRPDPEVLSVAGVLALDIPAPRMLIESLIGDRGVSLIVGAPKSGKTLLSVQMAIAVAAGHPLFDYYRVLTPGAVLLVEQDDPDGGGSVKDVLTRSPIPVDQIPFFVAPRIPFTFGLQLLEWLEKEITARSLRLVVLDSYTSLRSSRGSGIDIVKAEQSDLTMMDALAKRTACAITIVHHASKGSAALGWSDRGAGTYAMAAATESQIFIERFQDLASDAPERLVRVRGRHMAGVEMVLKFRRDTLDHEHVLEGGAAPFYPLLLQLQAAFGTQTFSPKGLSHATGVSIATSHRQIDKLHRAGALTKRGFGEYSITGLRG